MKSLMNNLQTIVAIALSGRSPTGPLADSKVADVHVSGLVKVNRSLMIIIGCGGFLANFEICQRPWTVKILSDSGYPKKNKNAATYFVHITL